MFRVAKAMLLLGLLSWVVGCHGDRPHEYGERRPDVDALHSDDGGLQSKDVVTASDQMARDLIANPDLRRSNVQWTMVADRLEDHTLDRQFNTNYDIFLQRLRTNVGLYGKGQVQLVENKAKLAQLRNKELDGGGEDMGQGGAPRPMPRLQPDFILHGKVFDMPNRATNFYLLQFDVTDLKSGAIIWTNKYEVKVAR